MVTWEGETERCSSAVGGEVHVVDEAIVWFFVCAVKVRSRCGETHGMTKLLLGEGLARITKGAKRPTAAGYSWEAVELIA